MTASLVVVGRIATLAGESGMGWAEAVAVADGRVVAAGSRAAVEAVTDARTRTLRLGPDEVAMPAITDAHLHLVDAALAEERLDLASLDYQAALDRIAAAHAAIADPEAWLEGDGWTADGWGAWPDGADLERVAPGRRAAFWAHDRHALWVSERALREAAVGPGSSDPAGGIVRRRLDGTPSGVLHELAAALVLERIPLPSLDRRAEAVAHLARRLLSAGVRAVHDPGSLATEPGLEAVGLYRALEAAGRLPIDVHVSVRRESLAAAIEAGLRSGDRLGPEVPAGAARARLGWLKLFADGTLGSRTAAMLAPFEPEPGRPRAGDERGMLLLPPGELAEQVRTAAVAGIASQVHAIGDAAVRAALDALEPTSSHAHGLGLAPRIEHAQLVDPVDLHRFARSGIVASVQPVHLGSDAASARMAWGDRADRAYPYRSLLDAGARLAFGTDAPVEAWDPWPGIEQAVTRSDPRWPAGTPRLGPGEGLDLAEAVRAACLGPALAAGQGQGGRLVPGSRADLLVIPASALATPVEPGGPLGRTRPRVVLVGGVEAAAG